MRLGGDPKKDITNYGGTLAEAIDKTLEEAFGTSDFYTLIAAKAAKGKVSDVTMEDRASVKQVMFCTIYGQGFPLESLKGLRKTKKQSD